MEKLLRKLLRNRAIVVFFMVLIALAGMFCYYIIPKQENPEATVAAAIITTIYPGASPEEVETFVTDKLEDKIRTLDRVKDVSSMSIESVSVITLMYEDDVHIDEVETRLRQTMDDAQAELPAMCQKPMVRTDLITNNAFIISLSSDVYTPRDLEGYADVIKQRLESVDGVTSVQVAGKQTRKVVVEADIEKLRTYGVSVEMLLGLLQAQNVNIPSGNVQYESGNVTVSAPALFENLDDIRNLVVGGAEDSLSFVKLKDIAEVFVESADDYYYQQDGRDAVLLVGKLQEGQNAVNIGHNLRKAIDQVQDEMPDEIGRASCRERV